FVMVFPLLFLFTHITPPNAIYTLSLHDALPIYCVPVLPTPVNIKIRRRGSVQVQESFEIKIQFYRAYIGDSQTVAHNGVGSAASDRKSTRLNSSHVKISYAVFCLKKQK